MVVVAKQTGWIYVLGEFHDGSKVAWRRDLKAFIPHPCSTWTGGSSWVAFLHLWFSTGVFSGEGQSTGRSFET